MNNVYFDKNQIEQGLHTKLINFLIEQSYSEQDGINYYNDIRIVPEDFGAISIQWESVDWDHEYRDSRWVWLDDEHEIVEVERIPYDHQEYDFDGGVEEG